MALTQSPSIVTNGLIMYYDMTNIQKSSTGAPTTNISTGMGIGTYLNTPSDVTSTLTQTGESYRGQPVYKQVLTPITATGVGYLTNAGNPGIGTVTGGGGGAAARFTGHSIFFKPAVGRLGLNSSTPIYTHYSNIGGWQSTGNFDDMGDGWYRAHVIFYSAGGGSDGKYWAINPAGATLGVPITVYWAAPFKEDRNDSTHVSPYVNDTRSNTQSILDLTGNNTVTANSLTYASDGIFSFNGSNNFVTISGGMNRLVGTNTVTFSAWIYRTSAPAYWSGIISNKVNVTDGICLLVNPQSRIFWQYDGGTSGVYAIDGGAILATNTWHNIVGVYDNEGLKTYLNGVLNHSASDPGKSISAAGNMDITIGAQDSGPGGPFPGQISIVQIYNRALSAAEIQQNFTATRGRYGL